MTPMNATTTLLAVLGTLGLLGILALGCSCSDRPVDETEREEQLRLCSMRCELGVDCSRARGSDLTHEECSNNCMESYFTDHNVGCHNVAKRLLECYITRFDSCERRPDCTDEGAPYWVCIGDPVFWAANDCDDKCPGECCADLGK
jgi:hypothetical protein